MNILDILPTPFDLIEIPKGSVTVNGKTETIEAFQIAKYPVTNAQFAKFIDAKGYQQKKWWTEAGWEEREQGRYYDKYDKGWKPSGTPWTEPRFWNDSQWNGKTHPVVGVSWYEAVAFCNWLNEIVGMASMQSAPQIMLPTEQQWQRKAMMGVSILGAMIGMVIGATIMLTEVVSVKQRM